MTYQSKVTSKGQITLPAKLRQALDLKPGDQIKFIETEDGHFEVVAEKKKASDLKGFFKTDLVLGLEEIDEAIAKAATGK